MSTLLLSPPVVDDATRREFLTGLAATGLLAGCAAPVPATEPAAATRPVTHLRDVTDVPVAPSRIVVLGGPSLAYVLALGVTPLAATAQPATYGQDFHPILDAGTAVVDGVSSDGETPDLEAVAALNPDLILIEERAETGIYDQLTAIAPTVVVEGGVTDLATEIRTLAAVLGVPGRADRIVEDFDAGLDAAEGTFSGSVSIILPYQDGTGTIRVYGSGFAPGSWFDRFGMPIVPDRTSFGVEVSGRDNFVEISTEQLGAVTGDTIVLFASLDADGGRAAFDTLLAGPLWATLPAVRTGRVLAIDTFLAVGSVGFQGLTATLDDLVAKWRALPALS